MILDLQESESRGPKYLQSRLRRTTARDNNGALEVGFVKKECSMRLSAPFIAALFLLVTGSCGWIGGGGRGNDDAATQTQGQGSRAGEDARAKSEGAGSDGAASPDGAVSTEVSFVDDPISALARMEDARRLSRPAVEQLLKSSDVVVRRRALLALGRVGNAEALAPLKTALTDSDAAMRQAALTSMGMLESSAHEDAERVLKAFLELSQKTADRRAAIEALGHVGSQGAIGPILAAIESPDPAMRASAARALGHMASRRREPGEQAAVAVASHLGDSDARVRLAVAFALSRSKSLSEAAKAPVGAALEKALRRDSDAEVRIMAARALGALDAGGAGYLLAAIENDDDWRVQTAAATAVARRGNVPQRTRGLKTAWNRLAKDPTRLNTPDLHPLRAQLVESAQRPAKGLGRVLRSIENGAAKLMESATDSRIRQTLAHIQCDAALAQDSISNRPARVTRCATTEPPLISPLERKVLSVRALRHSTDPGVQKRLRILIKAPELQVRLEAVESMASGIGDGRGGGRLRFLEKALLDESPHVVAAAAHKLASTVDFYHPKVVKPAQQLTIIEYTNDGPVTHSNEEAAIKGRQVPSQTIDKALKSLDAERDVEAAINLLKAAGALKAVKAAPAIRHYAGHHNQTVRRAARAALNALEHDPGPELRPDPPNLIDPAKLAQVVAGSASVAMETTKGTLVVKLRPDLAPATVVNFLALAEKGFYDGVSFHRIVPGFVSQTGDPTGTSYGGPGYTIRCELSGAPYERGTVGMALAGQDTGGSQFFITYSAQPHLERQYTVFGRVVEGIDVLDSLQPWDSIVGITRR